MFPLLAWPHSGQNFSCPLNGCPQFKHSGVFTTAILFFDFLSLMSLVLLVEK